MGTDAFDSPRPLSWRIALRCLAASVAVWAVFALMLGGGNYVDQLRQGKATSLLHSVAAMLPYFVAQMFNSGLIGMLLVCRPGLLNRPALLVGLAALSLPLYALVDFPLASAMQTLIAREDLAAFSQRLSQWSATQTWVNLMIAGGAMLAQLAWVSWRRGQARERAWRESQADNLRLRLTLLQGQLEPHFLFNTLNSIAALVRGAERTVALAALTRLSELLRYALRASQQTWVSVADELRFVDDYVALQRLRFGDALCWQQQVDDADWARWACPPLLLQPLVENAIRYGLEAGAAGAPLRFEVNRQGERLQIRLHNPRSAGAELMAGHGVGLAKTRERMVMLYGSTGGIQTDETSDEFHLLLHLPLQDLDTVLDQHNP